MDWLSKGYQALQWGNILGSYLCKMRHLGHLVLLAVMVTLAAGLMLFLIDPNIKSPLDGIWSAWVTMTHVGFGDVVPTSFLGRLLAGGLILLGMVLLSLFTALVSVALIGGSRDALGINLQQLDLEGVATHTGEERILAELARLHERMGILEKQLSANAGQDRPVASLLLDANGEVS